METLISQTFQWYGRTSPVCMPFFTIIKFKGTFLEPVKISGVAEKLVVTNPTALYMKNIEVLF